MAMDALWLRVKSYTVDVCDLGSIMAKIPVLHSPSVRVHNYGEVRDVGTVVGCGICKVWHTPTVISLLYNYYTYTVDSIQFLGAWSRTLHDARYI